ncbi:hypothetical protein PC121_g1507 [Phytophthora cactorum]|nr:hypothetical protein PC120_g2305 [Phytophthora cactorum]KAG3101042.1 hypothetical protein PC121_g1507 [Phytophthora cactorum]KAG4059647.1 hypothetical protein PC123_g5431 [Phytophthora cactorum]
MASFLTRVLILLPVITVHCSSPRNAAACYREKLLSALSPLKLNSNYSTCQTNLKPKQSLCDSKACKALIAPLASLDLPSCTVSKTSRSYNPVVLNNITTAICDDTDPFSLFGRLVYQHIMEEVLQLMQGSASGPWSVVSA